MTHENSQKAIKKNPNLSLNISHLTSKHAPWRLIMSVNCAFQLSAFYSYHCHVFFLFIFTLLCLQFIPVVLVLSLGSVKKHFKTGLRRLLASSVGFLNGPRWWVGSKPTLPCCTFVQQSEVQVVTAPKELACEKRIWCCGSVSCNVHFLRPSNPRTSKPKQHNTFQKRTLDCIFLTSNKFLTMANCCLSWAHVKKGVLDVGTKTYLTFA